MSSHVTAKRFGSRWLLAGLLVLFASLLAMPAPAASSLYDTLAGTAGPPESGLTTIDSTKWANLEQVRAIQGGKLVSILHVLAVANGYGNDTQFAAPAGINAVQADVRMNSPVFPPDGGNARMRIQVALYHASGGTGAGDATGDVRAQLAIQADSASHYHIGYTVYQCTVSDCSSNTTLTPFADLLPGATLGTTYTLGIGWDNSSGTLKLSVNGTETDESLGVTTPPAPNVPYVALGTRLNTGLNSSNAFARTGGEGYVTGDFANVYTNTSASFSSMSLYDDFSGTGGSSGPALLPSKWANLEVIRGIQGGALNLVSAAGWQGSGSSFNRQRTRESFLNTKAISAIKADVTLSNMTTIPTTSAAGGRVALGGAFYNNGTGNAQNNNATGDVRAYVRLIQDSSAASGALSAHYYVEVCTSADCSTTTNLPGAGGVLGPVATGVTYTIGISWDGSQFLASLLGGTYGNTTPTTLSFTPTSPYLPAGPPVSHAKEINSDAKINSAGGYAYVGATVANVYVVSVAPTPPTLAPYYQTQLPGNVVAAGVGLAGGGTQVIALPSAGSGGIPTGATIDKALLYWGVVANSDAYGSINFDGNSLTGTLIGQSDDPNAGTLQTYGYRADVTSYVSPSVASYNVQAPGLPSVSGGEIAAGATLVVVYNNSADSSEKVRAIRINDGAVLLGGEFGSPVGPTQTYYETDMTGFTVSPSPDARLVFVVGGGGSLQGSQVEAAGINQGVLSTGSLFTGTDGNYWNTLRFDTLNPANDNPLLNQLGLGQSYVYPSLSSGGSPAPPFVWVASAFSATVANTLTVNRTGMGIGNVQSSPPGINCGLGTYTCSGPFASGSSVTLTATPATVPASGSSFAGWSGGGCSGTGTCTVTMSGDQTVTATFMPIGAPAGQSLSLNVTGSGVVSSSMGGLSCGNGNLVCGPMPLYGSPVLTATPASGSSFSGWGGDCAYAGTNLSCVIDMTQARSVSATFTGSGATTYPLNVTVTGPGLVTSDIGGIDCGGLAGVCSATLTSGASVTLSASGSSGSFNGWGGDCAAMGTSQTCTLTMSAGRSVSAIFSQGSGPVLYDDFFSGQIDTTRWATHDIIRKILSSGTLVSGIYHEGSPGSYSNDLSFVNPGSVSSLQAAVQVTDYLTRSNKGRIRLKKALFNDGTGSVSTGAIGDVRAQVFLQASGTPGSGGTIQLGYSVFRCTNFDCSTSTDIVAPTLVGSTVALNESHTVALSWASPTVTFTLDATPYPVDLTASLGSNQAPWMPQATLGSQAVLNSTGPGGGARVVGTFSSVLANGSSYDTFPGPRLDPTKWSNLEVVRISDGSGLESTAAVSGQIGSQQPTPLYFVNQNGVMSAQADVVVNSYVATNAQVQASVLGGAFYNDGGSSGPGNATGDVQAFIRLIASNGGPLTANFLVNRCNDVFCSNPTQIYNQDLGTVGVGETHTLHLGWDGANFNYGIEGVSGTYGPGSPYLPVKPAVQHFKDLRTQANVLSAGGYGYIDARFDNVFVDGDVYPLPGLAPAYQRTLVGDVLTAGTGLLGTGSGTITLSGLPEEATVQKAFLYVGILENGDFNGNPTFNGTPLMPLVVQVGQSDDPFTGGRQASVLRMDVTSIVAAQGNGSYSLAGLPDGTGASNGTNTLGATLVVVYASSPGTQRVISINDGSVTLAGSRVSQYATSFPTAGFQTASSTTGSKLTFVVGNGASSSMATFAGIGSNLLATNDFTGHDGANWDTRTYDVSSYLSPSSAVGPIARISTGGPSLLWAAAILSVPGSQTPPYALNVTLTGSGAGSVTSVPAGINCSSGSCGTTFAADTSVTLTATPAPGSVFMEWTGDCTGSSASCTVTMNRVQSVTARFTLLSVTVNSAGAGSGSIVSSPSGINCGLLCSAPFVLNTSVTLTATAASNSTFLYWTGACTGTGPSCTVTANQPQAATAVFGSSSGNFDLGVDLIGTGAGLVTSSPPGVSCSAGPCSTSFPSGTSVTLTATPASGSSFAGWTGDCTNSSGTCQVTMDQARNVWATFNGPSFLLSVSIAGNGTGLVSSTPAGIICSVASCSAPFTSGTGVTLSAVPASGSGSTFGGWSGDCSGIGICSLTMNAPHSVTATFSAASYSLTVSTSGSGAGSVSSTPPGITNCSGGPCTAMFTSPTSVTLTATAASGSSFAGWIGDCTGTGSCQVTMDQVRNVNAMFTTGGGGGTYALYVTNIGGGTGSVCAAPTGQGYCPPSATPYLVTFPAGTAVTLYAYPADGNAFTGWSWSGSTFGPPPNCFNLSACTIPMNQAQNVAVIFATGTSPGGTQPLTVDTTGGGHGNIQSTPSGINCSVASCSADFGLGSAVALSAATASGSSFGGWSGACSGMNPLCTVTMSGAQSATATFNLTGATYTLTVTPPAHGTVLTPGFAGIINCGTGGSACSADVVPGTTVVLVATPDTGALFLGWSGDCHGTGPCVLSLSQARAVGANFAQVPSVGTLAYSLLHSFNGTDGATPYSGLILGGDGYFYGVTSEGGANSLGSAFKMDTAGAITTLHSFAGEANGSAPYGALLLASDGNFYGTTFGSEEGGGIVFKMDGSGTVTILHSFDGSDGSGAWSRLIQGMDGNLYGTTMAGGPNNVGAIFKVDPSGAVSTFHTFSTTGGDGVNPYGGLTQGTDGFFYGTTKSGGSSSNGTLYKVDPTGPTVTKVHDFIGSDGANPTGSLILAADGYFYGTTSSGGASGLGTVFKVDTSGSVTTLHNFAGSDGANPYGDLLQGSDGNFYGTTYNGGDSGIGTVFRMDGSGNVTTLHSFANSTSDGNHPWYGGLVQGGNGYFYGMTSAGGAGGVGTAFVLQPGATLSVSVSGSGLVTSSPAGISCSVASCSANFASGQAVTLTATPASGSYFAGWSGDCTGATCQVTMNAAQNVTAMFTAGTIYPLNVTVNGTGLVTSSPGGINCSVASCSAGFVSGSPVTLTASGSFTGWGGACTGQGTNPSCTVMMSSSKSVTANFSGGAGPYPLTVNVTGAGLVTSNPGGINCSVASCSASFVSDANISLMANPASGSSFTGWGGDCGYAGTNSTCLVDMNTPHTVSAAFTGGAPATAVLTVYPTGGGLGSIVSNQGGIACPASCSADFPVNPSTAVILTASPSSGSSFLGWSGEACTGTGTCTVTMGQGRNVAAMFGAPGTPQFATGDLDGTWTVYKFGDSTNGNNPNWLVLTLTLSNGTLVSGSYLPSDDTSGSLTGATFVIDPVTGLVAGAAWDAGGGISFPYAKLDATKTLLTSVTSEEATGRGLAVGIKSGGSFSSTDLAGTWNISRFNDNTGPTSNNPTWTALTITLDGTGALVSGAYLPSDGASGSFVSGAFTIDANGVVSGALTNASSNTLPYPYGKLDPSKTTLALVAGDASTTRRSLGIGTKAGGSFTPADLAGTWSLAFYGDTVGPTNNNPTWTAVTLTLDTSGALLAGTFVDARGYAGAIASGSFTLDGAGRVSGYIANGPTFPTGNLNQGKTLLALVATDTSSTPNGRGLLVGSKAELANTKAALLSPAPGSTLAGTTQTFTWSAGTGALEYALFLGTTPGGLDLYVGSTGLNTGVTVENLPGNGSPIYVRLYTRFATGWEFTDSTLTAALSQAKAALVSPAPGSTLTGTSQAFTWSAGTGALEYALFLGTTPGGLDLYVGSTGLNTGVTVENLPGNGSPIYVRLYTRFATGWEFTDSTLTAALSQAKAALVSPAPGSTLAGTSQTFTWTAGTGALEYALFLGTTPGGLDLYVGSTGLNTGVTVENLPGNGSPIYVRLYTRFATGWEFTDYTLTAVLSKASLVSPAPGSTLTDTTVTFTWTTSSAALEYALFLGTTPGNTDLFVGSTALTPGVTVAGLPSDGSPIYVRVFTRFTAGWQSTDATVTAVSRATLTSPAPGSTLPGSTATFTWSAGTGALEYALFLGTTPGNTDLFVGSTGLTPSVTVHGLPGGITLYARISTRFPSGWQYTDYTFTTGLTKAGLTSPANGSTLAGTTQTFTWSAGFGALEYALFLGTTPGGLDLFISSTGLNTGVTVAGLPAGGTPLYIRLWTRFATGWEYTDSSVTTASSLAALVSPLPGSTLSGASVTFTWTAGLGALEYALFLGTTPGGLDLYVSSTGLTTGATVNGLPTGGSPLYARLFTRFPGGWQATDYSFTTGP